MRSGFLLPRRARQLDRAFDEARQHSPRKPTVRWRPILGAVARQVGRWPGRSREPRRPGEPACLVILLSSFNGRRFITDQINSIRRQTHSAWTLLIRDDGSTDNTVDLVESLAKQDERISLLRDTKGNLGPAASFGVLLSHALDSAARYVAIADQDDVWLPGKLARELELLRDQEATAGLAIPILVHSDLAVVREDLSLLHRSFLEFQGIRHQFQAALPRLLVQNSVTGSTVVLNRALLGGGTGPAGDHARLVAGALRRCTWQGGLFTRVDRLVSPAWEVMRRGRKDGGQEWLRLSAGPSPGGTVLPTCWIGRSARPASLPSASSRGSRSRRRRRCCGNSVLPSGRAAARRSACGWSTITVSSRVASCRILCPFTPECC